MIRRVLTLAATAIAGATAVVPGTAVAPTTARAATGPILLDEPAVCNSQNVCGRIELYLNESNGQVHARLISREGAITGSVAKLETSGYDDFRNVPYAWSRTVGDTTHGDGSTYVNTDDVSYSYPGADWWWRGCGYIGSGGYCTYAFTFSYSTGIGWKIRYFNGYGIYDWNG
ncbi:hypothetical protein [Actinoallomurus acaciae]|uniref:Peptidase inhibitor family I36 n=1 Tax=Actinoallomurus acaciae TaxID=502577 RepID=A0ABV5YU97_9ACTN